MQMRFDLDDKQWETLEALLLSLKDPRGRKPDDLRRTVNGVCYLLRTGIPWRDLPERYGHWKSVYSQFRRWNKSQIWQQIHAIFMRDADLETCYIDSTAVVVHQSGLGAKGGSIMKQ